jgi:hypothetical protein
MNSLQLENEKKTIAALKLWIPHENSTYPKKNATICLNGSLVHKCKMSEQPALCANIDFGGTSDQLLN